ncbi:hypothetical protein DRN46_01285 [Thermococci archaeon]|nr:MAG: hypothetical protein DRN46_01285 [Thermococci archaeon]RLF95227.1 MAG: hypothetical protein DRN52_04150 [Thermococci archaeon]
MVWRCQQSLVSILRPFSERKFRPIKLSILFSGRSPRRWRIWEREQLGIETKISRECQKVLVKVEYFKTSLWND